MLSTYKKAHKNTAFPAMDENFTHNYQKINVCMFP